MDEEWGALEEEVEKRYPEQTTRWDHLPVFPGAETFNALLQRSVEELSRIGERHPGETIVVVGHGRVLKTLIAHMEVASREAPYPANCGIAEFSYSDDEGIQFVKVFEDRAAAVYTE